METQTKQRVTRKGNAKQSSKAKRTTLKKEQNSVPQIQMLEIDFVSPDPTQPRKTFDEQSLNHLAQSIAEHGVLQPITVRKSDDGYIIVMGERRFHASKLAGLTTIPAMVRDYGDTEILEVQIIENLQRKDVEPTEEAEAIQFLLDGTRTFYQNGPFFRVFQRINNKRRRIAHLLTNFNFFNIKNDGF
ncbi:ParB/RepB/Spo0J family partition protein [Flagellimonas amoyensis]|uniref:ParB/RepB/Spo0J family partition protein n=1 Tax=Flagellimonas amoyensis TaxID=2169401 RepID=UPI000D3560AD|nr:ParB/RepB/Spo0J family partition protein [Allomuricauda amoyensis]